jgi:hypothetical protein
MVVKTKEWEAMAERASQADIYERQVSRLQGLIAELTAERVLDITKPKAKPGRPKKSDS